MPQDQHRTPGGSHTRKHLGPRGLPVDVPDPEEVKHDPSSGDDEGSNEDRPSIPAQDITEPNPTRIGER